MLENYNEVVIVDTLESLIQQAERAFIEACNLVGCPRKFLDWPTPRELANAAIEEANNCRIASYQRRISDFGFLEGILAASASKGNLENDEKVLDAVRLLGELEHRLQQLGARTLVERCKCVFPKQVTKLGGRNVYGRFEEVEMEYI